MRVITNNSIYRVDAHEGKIRITKMSRNTSPHVAPGDEMMGTELHLALGEPMRLSHEGVFVLATSTVKSVS